MKLFVVGGFLGSGKTTAIHQAGSSFLKQKKKIAVITNDQGADLVDTQFIKSAGIKTEEVINGCFCCNYNQFSQSIQTLQDTVQPEIIFAESVGSCTDLIATIAKPLNNFNPEITVVISIFADAQLLYSLIEGNASFLSDQVRYIYKKQMTEADILIINKIDLLSPLQIRKVKEQIGIEYPGKILLYQNSLDQNSISKWTSTLTNFRLIEERQSLDLDYRLYAEGEAMLAWLDQKIIIETNDYTAYAVANQFVHAVCAGIKWAKHPVAHVKFFLDDGFEQHKISLTTVDDIPKNVNWSDNRVNTLSILMNARVEAAFFLVEKIVSDVLDETRKQANCKIFILQAAAFQPSYPQPTHRMI